jgi:hypothetical protein
MVGSCARTHLKLGWKILRQVRRCNCRTVVVASTEQYILLTSSVTNTAVKLFDGDTEVGGLCQGLNGASNDNPA